MRRGPGASSWCVISRSAATGMGFEWLTEAVAGSPRCWCGLEFDDPRGKLVMFGCLLSVVGSRKAIPGNLKAATRRTDRLPAQTVPVRCHAVMRHVCHGRDAQIGADWWAWMVCPGCGRPFLGIRLVAGH
jgi:hypothetical protein